MRETVDASAAHVDGLTGLNRIRSLLSTSEPDEALRLCEEHLGGPSPARGALGLKAQALFALERIQEATLVAQQAASAEPGDPEGMIALGYALVYGGRPDEGIAQFDRALAERPSAAKAHAGRGLGLAAAGRGEEAVAAYQRAARLEPRDAAMFIEIGHLMLRLGTLDNALAAFGVALRLRPGWVPALEGSSLILIALNRHAEALPGLEVLRSKKPESDYLDGSILHARLNCCDWTGFEALSASISTRLKRGERADAPLSYLAHSESAADQRRCAEIYVRDRCTIAATGAANARQPSGQANRRLRIGYLSADFRNHPVAQQLVGVLEAHDRAQIETFGLSAGPSDGSPLRRRLESAIENWVQVGARQDAAIASQMRDLAIDIAVDLGGHTTGSRTRVLAHRPAAVQVAFLGFPGTLGADFIDYIVADRHVIPDSERGHYTEQVIYMPDSYMPCDIARPLGVVPTRAQAGLPEKAMVFSCFNAPYKLSPRVFDCWMQILSEVPGSVLWLRDCADPAKANLANEARRRAVDPSRLRYAEKVPALADHYARLSLADLFLDSYPYNAHTTACDALAAGVPVITVRGRPFASRVGTSLLHAVGLGELSVDTFESYARLAITIARDPERLLRLKAQLCTARSSAPLFDPELFCRHLETAYFEISRRRRRGEAPSVLRVGGA
jgi:predicted O-linked N-acetylglucosamine transferase (SPINDLY family)